MYCIFRRKLRKTAGNGRFGAMAAVARRQFCGNFNVIIPQQVQWKPRLRQAAGTLEAMRGQCVEQGSENLNEKY